ncbi:hypothetical protein B0H16DRAFT_1861695 [Mycena metata]|uniref:Uncharacterized protein n=1 Tax=Mycena metata TaxID=1033252 RepID=A0AAD7IHM4_9AGAR|nr:hypothetical protein B0H16DRAFT_1861695 [Mycena metata]
MKYVQEDVLERGSSAGTRPNSPCGTGQKPRGTGASITQPPPRQCRVTARQCRSKSRQARHFLPARVDAWLSTHSHALRISSAGRSRRRAPASSASTQPKTTTAPTPLPRLLPPPPLPPPRLLNEGTGHAGSAFELRRDTSHCAQHISVPGSQGTGWLANSARDGVTELARARVTVGLACAAAESVFRTVVPPMFFLRSVIVCGYYYAGARGSWRRCGCAYAAPHPDRLPGFTATRRDATSCAAMYVGRPAHREEEFLFDMATHPVFLFSRAAKPTSFGGERGLTRSAPVMLSRRVCLESSGVAGSRVVLRAHADTESKRAEVHSPRGQDIHRAAHVEDGGVCGAARFDGAVGVREGIGRWEEIAVVPRRRVRVRARTASAWGEGGDWRRGKPTRPPLGLC